MTTKQRATKKYNLKLHPRILIKGYLVWRMATIARKKDNKFSTNWEGPYGIPEYAGEGAYKLEQLSWDEISNTWNVSHLKFYFS